MNSRLKFCIRILIVAIVGICVSFVVNSASPEYCSALERSFRRMAGEPTGQQIQEPTASTETLVKNKEKLAFFLGLGSFFCILGFLETIRYGRFRSAVSAVSDHGTVQYGTSSEATLANFYFSNPTIDLSCAKMVGATMPPFKHIPGVAFVRFCNAEVDKNNLRLVNGCRNLVGLDLSGTAVDDLDVSELEDLPNLETLQLSNTNVTNKVLGFLIYHPQLKKLDYEGTKISDQEVEAFCSRR